MAKPNEYIIAQRLSQITGLPESTRFLIEFDTIFEGPIHFEANESLWKMGDKDGCLWYIHKGYGFDKMLLEDGTKMLNGMIEPGIFICDESSLLWGGKSKTGAVMNTPSIAYRVKNSKWREHMVQNESLQNVMLNINSHFVQMRKLRLMKMKMMDKLEYWKYIQDRFPGIENYCSQTEIARYFGVSKSTMHRIVKSEEDQ